MLEVSTPLLSASTVTDPHIASFEVAASSQTLFLQTSPEFAMKKLLARGAGPIYSLGPVFRAGEIGTHHNPEFAMLEWYRPGFCLAELQHELSDLIQHLSAPNRPFPPPQIETYANLFVARFGLNPHLADVDALRDKVEEQFPEFLSHIEHADAGEKDDLLDVLFSEGIQPELIAPYFVTQFPASQASLAKTALVDGVEVSLRTELYWQGHEIANGYDELQDPVVLSQRIARDNAIRQSRNLPMVRCDDDLLMALEVMPACSGIAVGVDRLLMVLAGKQRLSDVLG